MKIHFEHQGARYACDLSNGRSLAIRLEFDGPQPNHFGAAKAARVPLRSGSFVGRTSCGGSCNVDELSIVPHCNGTHTETVAHIVDDDVFVGQVVPSSPMFALLISAAPIAASETNDTYHPPLVNSDRVITAKAIKSRLDESRGYDALIVRTLPNAQSKKSQIYSTENQPAFLTVEAMKAIVESGVKHLLMDVPSVDRMHDEGLLTNHHLFWNVAEHSHRLTAEVWQDKTITEIIFVPDDILDGFYLLSIQVPDFCADAAPARPVVYPVDEIPENVQR